MQIVDLPDVMTACQIVNKNRDTLISAANAFCASMQARGGGVIDIVPRVVEKRTLSEAFLVVHIQMDVCESMGANVVNTVAEGVAPAIVELVGGRAALRILSNMCLERRASSSFRIPFDALSWKGVHGATVAKLIVEAYEFAESDPFRAATHNKGIMNGIDAVAVATGQDWRAIEASAHSWACRNGYYGSITSYALDGDALVGSIEMPIAVGVKGGALHTHPVYRFTMELLGGPSSADLAQIIVSVGLAQNFAALRALAVEGIQRGHMSLHARNIAVAAGAASDLVPEVATYMTRRNMVSLAVATEYLEAHRLMTEVSLPASKTSERRAQPSTFHLQVDASTGFTVKLNVVVPTLGARQPVHMFLKRGVEAHPLQEALLGSGKDAAWISTVYDNIDMIRLASKNTPRENVHLLNKLKLACVAFNLISHNLMQNWPAKTGAVLQAMLATPAVAPRDLFRKMDKAEYPPGLALGLPLLVMLEQMFLCSIEQWVHKTTLMVSSLKGELRAMIECVARKPLFSVSIADASSDVDLLNAFMSSGHSKRWPASFFLLCDALAMDPTTLTAQRIDLLHRVGEFFEFEAMFAHDCSRFDRDQGDERVPNIYKAFLDARRLQHSAKSLARYRDAVDSLCMGKRLAIIEQGHADEIPFDVELLLKASRHLRQYYGQTVMSGDLTPRSSTSERSQ